ncbi:hypothetical protein GQX73_g4410 [Xylaria multiplex]|uniref:Uncharacterized protein n=1 Tax=Xylaria multiplex TaxID=323545 RepID=A0A7C8MQT6_9PEZI|nr:hypothetical protein GQX73_g4410 [Xylaria multiplex]
MITVLLSLLFNAEKFSAKLKTEYWEGWKLLHMVAANGYVEAVKLVLERGADVNVECSIGDDSTSRFTALDLAYSKLYDGEKGDIECENWVGLTPLQLAVTDGRYEMVSILLAFGAKVPDTPILDSGLPALHGAVIERDTQMVTLPLDGGADSNVFSPEGLLPLHICSGHDPEMAQLLIEHGPDWDFAFQNYLMKEMTTLNDV